MLTARGLHPEAQTPKRTAAGNWQGYFTCKHGKARRGRLAIADDYGGVLRNPSGERGVQTSQRNRGQSGDVIILGAAARGDAAAV